jgi:hypothetical protein
MIDKVGNLRDDTSSDSSITLMAFYCSEKGAVPPLSYEESTSDYRAHGPDSVTGSPPRHSTPNTSRSSGRGYTLFEVDNLVSVLELYLLYCLILGQHMRFVHVAEFSYPHSKSYAICRASPDKAGTPPHKALQSDAPFLLTKRCRKEDKSGEFICTSEASVRCGSRGFIPQMNMRVLAEGIDFHERME